MTTKQTSPTPEQIDEYALKRWAEAKGWTKVTTCDQARRVGQGHKENTPHFHKGHNCEHLIPENPNLPGTINHAFFAELPMDDEEVFIRILTKIILGEYPTDQEIFEHGMALVNATIGQLVLAYYQAGNE